SPTNAWTSPALSSKETPRSAWTAPKDLVMLVSWSNESVMQVPSCVRQAPSTKHQAPEKLQIPKAVGAPLEVGAWDFSGAWCLGFGALVTGHPPSDLAC